MPTGDDKATLRGRLRATRDALPPRERERLARALCEHLDALPCVRSARLIAGYRAFGSEADVNDTLLSAHRRGVALALPRVASDTALTLHAWTPGEPLLTSRWGIAEPAGSAPEVAPETVSVVLVPALAVDARGHRLGYGRGYYDRLLPRLVHAVRVGVAFELQCVPELEAGAHDVPLDFVVTETGARAVAH